MRPGRRTRAAAAAGRLAEAMLRVAAFGGLAGLVGIVVADVALRATGLAVPGVFELVTTALMVSVALAMPAAFRRGSHVALGAPGERLSGAAARVAAFGGLALSALATGAIGLASLWRGVAAWRAGTVTPDLGFSVAWQWLPLAAGMLASAVLLACMAAASAVDGGPGPESGPETGPGFGAGGRGWPGVPSAGEDG